MARAPHRLSNVGAAAVVVTAALTPVGLVPVPVLARYELRSPRTAGGYSRPKTYVTAAGTFKASFHGTPVTQVVGAPEQTFTMVARWAHGPVVSVRYQRFPAKIRSPYWHESVVLVHLDAGSELRALSLLTSQAQLPVRLIRRGRSGAAGVPQHGRRPDPELGRPGGDARRHVRGPRRR